MASQMVEVGVIRRLDEVVVNRIAAGEVIQRPANAIKELIENCLDANATCIQVAVRQGGLKVLQIQDNGCGICKQDMDIVCERFTTSKLRHFEDLLSISTYGFRGEALASISHVAHMTITSRTADAKCAYRGQYSDGKPTAPVKPCAGNIGTQITVEDLFYNMVTRRRALRSPGEEYGRIVDVITRELLEVSAEVSHLGLKLEGCVTNANYSVKKSVFLLFINHRLVDSSAIRRALDSLYQAFLPKGMHPFIYLSLEILPQNVDVNIHPTKHEVHFLHEDAIIASVQSAVEERLLSSNTSRTFFAQTLFPSNVISGGRDSSSSDVAVSALSNVSSREAMYAHQMVRTDTRSQKLDAFLSSRAQPSPDCRPSSPVTSNEPQHSDVIVFSEAGNEPHQGDQVLSLGVDSEAHHPDLTSPSGTQCVESLMPAIRKSSSSRREIKLSSVLSLCQEIDDSCHSGLREVFREHKFVGCVTEELALLQYQTKLYLTNTRRLSEHLFYQITMFDFGSFGIFRLSEPASLYELAMLALDSEESGWTEADGPKEELSSFVGSVLGEHADMLQDYFSFAIDRDGNLLTLPMLLADYRPPLAGLPLFVLRLATEVTWESETECFRTIATELSHFYAVRKDVYSEFHTSHRPPSMSPRGAGDASLDAHHPVLGKAADWRWTVEHVVYPAFRTMLKPPRSASDDTSVVQLANLPDLYKVFERC